MAGVPAVVAVGSVVTKKPEFVPPKYVAGVDPIDEIKPGPGIFRIMTGEQGYKDFEEVSREYYISQIEQGETRWFQPKRRS